MTIDYDVVIIGGSVAGRYAALMATQLRAKVALVEPKTNYGFVFHHVFNEISKYSQQLNNAAQFGIQVSHPDISEQCQISVVWQDAMLYARGVVSNVEEQYSPAFLAAQGVDVILGEGQFQSSSKMTFIVNNRPLWARTYLLACGSVPTVPDIEGLQKTGFLTLADIWQSLNNSVLPKNWVIIGGVPQSVEIAQTLTRLGCSVTLICDRPYIIRHADPEITQLLQAQLEAEGVRVLTRTAVTQVRLIDDKKWLQAGDKAIETDEILVATGQQPNINSLNLASVGVKWHGDRLVINEKLQTTNRRIYACGDVIGGYDFPHLTNYEARIALKNALFFPRFKVNYRFVPWGIFSQPMMVQVGWTETQAKRRFHQDEIIVIQQYFKTLAAAQIREEITGICKFIVRRNGEILGASLLGAEACELINVISLAIAQNIKVNQLADLSPLVPSFSEILVQTAREWNKQKLNNNILLQELLETFFHFRRNWKL